MKKIKALMNKRKSSDHSSSRNSGMSDDVMASKSDMASNDVTTSKNVLTTKDVMTAEDNMASTEPIAVEDASSKVNNEQTHPKLLVAAIDFGTTFSGWAFLFHHQYISDPTKAFAKNWNNGTNISAKTPTTILIKPDGRTVEAFGYDAEDRYAALAEEDKHHDYYYFRRFKMTLFNKKSLKRNITLDDENGHQLPAMMVFKLAIDCLRDDIMTQCKKQISDGNVTDGDIHWVLTVPAIWNDGAKQFMREAAKEAGISTDRLSIALEPEAASLFCKSLSVQKHGTTDCFKVDTFEPGTRYMVVDAGGGTIDIAVHEVLENNGLREIERASGGEWGGTQVDENFLQFLIKIVGAPIMIRFKKEHMDDYIDLLRQFEVKKRTVTMEPDKSYIINLPTTLVDLFKEVTDENLKDAILHTQFNGNVSLKKGNKLQLESLLMIDFFKDVLYKITGHLLDLLKNTSSKQVKFILMVGGFSECCILQQAITRTCSTVNVIVAPDSSLVVLKGAAIFGHQEAVIEERVSRYTYSIGTDNDFEEGFHPEQFAYINYKGTKKCSGSLSNLTVVGEILKNGERRELDYLLTPVYDEADQIVFPLYASTEKSPRHETDEEVLYIGVITVNVTDMTIPQREREFKLSSIWGKTEITLEFKELSTGIVSTKVFNALE